MSAAERVWRAGLPRLTYEWALIPENEPRSWEFAQAVRALPQRQAPWEPFPVEVVSPRESETALRAKIPFWSGSRNVLVLRDEAIESVGAVLERHGELLPLEGRNARLVMFTGPLVSDALREDESELHRSPGSIYVRLDRGVFRADRVGDLKAFVVPVGRGYDLILSDGLVQELEATGDTAGVVFEQMGVLRHGP